uniref:non-specific serine/threonine protein kinase n=1 Tax=Oryza glumipatula TaxID=40148 RepID=A0A0E0B280_9ORYZ
MNCSRQPLYLHFPLGCLLLLMHAPGATSLAFSFNFSSSGNLCGTAELRCERDASMSSDVLDLTKADNQGAVYNAGRASYSRPVPLWDNATGELASFSSNFTFQIRPINETVYRFCNITGDGMAFFLAHYPSTIPPRSFGQNLGLLNDSNHFGATGDDCIVAVEFDTYENVDWDPSTYHVGIDVSSIRSTAYTNVSENLASNQSIVTAEVSYNNLTGVLSAHVRINDDELYNVSAPVDMKVSLPEEVSVGFSAGTGRCLELNQVHSWSFSSTLKSKDPAMAPAPAPPTTFPSTRSTKKSKKVVIILLLSVLIPLMFLMACAAAVLHLWKRHKRVSARNDTMDSDSDAQLEREELERGVAAGGPRRYAYRELAAATSNFAEEEKLGRGGCGSVYRGDLALAAGGEGRPVAIKMFSMESSSAQGRKEFEAEVTVISRLKHRNLVKLIGWCDSRKGLMLVYDLVAEGSLDKHLYSRQRLLSWSERCHIILGLGSALRYLHGEWEQCVLHGDIKPSNIMLDASLSTKLGDFGLARLVDHGARWTTTHAVLGTAGYIDPEFVNTRRPSTESDVYSFGIVLLEIATGRPPVTDTPDGFFVLLKWVWNLYGQSSILDAVDPRLRGDDDNDDEHSELWQMERVLVVGLWCAHPDRSERPSIAQAMHVLQSDDVTQLPALPRQLYRTVPQLAITGRAYGSRSDEGSGGAVVQSSETTDGTALSFD